MNKPIKRASPNNLDSANVPKPCCAWVILADKYMNGESIDALNKGIQALVQSLCRDDLASKHIEAALVRFGSDGSVSSRTLVRWVSPITQANRHQAAAT